MSYEYKIGSLFTLTGTVVVTLTTELRGTGTLFDTELTPGDLIIVNGEMRTITLAGAPELAAVDTPFVTAVGGVGYRLRLTNVETLGLPSPKGLFTPYTQPVILGDGSVRGAGWKTAEWKWGFLTRAQRDLLRAYCPGASADVYISTRTTDNADAFAIFNAKMVWPQTEEPQAGRRLDFAVKFQGLVTFP